MTMLGRPLAMLDLLLLHQVVSPNFQLVESHALCKERVLALLATREGRILRPYLFLRAPSWPFRGCTLRWKSLAGSFSTNSSACDRLAASTYSGGLNSGLSLPFYIHEAPSMAPLSAADMAVATARLAHGRWRLLVMMRLKPFSYRLRIVNPTSAQRWITADLQSRKYTPF